MATLDGGRTSGYRSKAVRSGAAIGARLFSSGPQQRPFGRTDDAQACIRSALRRRRRTLGLTQEAAGRVLGMSRLTYNRIEIGTHSIYRTRGDLRCLQLPYRRARARWSARQRVYLCREGSSRRGRGINSTLGECAPTNASGGRSSSTLTGVVRERRTA